MVGTKRSIATMAKDKDSKSDDPTDSHQNQGLDKDWIEKTVEKVAKITCKDCNSFMPNKTIAMMPSIVKKLDLLRYTPETLAEVLEDAYILSETERVERLRWPISLMGAAVALLCHHYHQTSVHCGIIVENHTGVRMTLQKETDLVFLVAFRSMHYALFEIDLVNSVVTIYESLSHGSTENTFSLWRDLVIHALRQYCHEEVASNGDNVVIKRDGEITKRHDNLPWWQVTINATYVQTNYYACGPIVVNRLAWRLKEISESAGGHLVSGYMKKFSRAPETLRDSNCVTAVELVQCLLRRHDGSLFEFVAPEEDHEDKDRHVVSGKDEEHNVRGNCSLLDDLEEACGDWTCVLQEVPQEILCTMDDTPAHESELPERQEFFSLLDDLGEAWDDRICVLEELPQEFTCSMANDTLDIEVVLDYETEDDTPAHESELPERSDNSITSQVLCSTASEAEARSCSKRSRENDSGCMNKTPRPKRYFDYYDVNDPLTSEDSNEPPGRKRRCASVVTRSSLKTNMQIDPGYMDVTSRVKRKNSMADAILKRCNNTSVASSSLNRRRQIDPLHINATWWKKRMAIDKTNIITQTKQRYTRKALAMYLAHQKKKKKGSLCFDVEEINVTQNRGEDKSNLLKESNEESVSQTSSGNTRGDDDSSFTSDIRPPEQTVDRDIDGMRKFLLPVDNRPNDDPIPPPELDLERDENLEDDFNFPSALDIKSNPGGALSSLRFTVDVDSLYLIANRASDILEFIGSEGAVAEFQSSLSRIQTSDSSRLTIDYGGAMDLQPRMTGKMRSWKKVSLDKFPNVELFKLRKGVIDFRVHLHLIRPGRIGDNNRMCHDMLLTLVAALNCAISASFAHDIDVGDCTTFAPDGVWSGLNSFELQSESKRFLKKIKSSHKSFYGVDASVFLLRLERVLSLMSTDPGQIDSDAQEEKTVEGYWKFRQMISGGGAGVFVPLELMMATAKILLNHVMFVASAAGVKDTYDFENRREVWDGAVETINSNNVPSLLRKSLSRFKEEQFVRIKASLLAKFPGLDESHRLFATVPFFLDVGVNCRPTNPEHYLTTKVAICRAFVRKCIRGSVPDDASVASVNENEEEEAVVVVVEEAMEQGEESDSVSNVEETAEEEAADFLLEEEIEPGEEFGQGPGPVEGDEEVPFWISLWEKIKLSVMFFRKHFSQHHGNVHGGKFRLCPFLANRVLPSVDEHEDAGDNDLDIELPEENLPEEDRIYLAHTGKGHVGNLQIYNPSLRVEEMAQTRPEKSSVFSLLPHAINLFCNGVYIFGASMMDSMKVLAEGLPPLSELFYHRIERRSYMRSPNGIRFEFFLVWNTKDDAGQMVSISHLPDFDPSACIEVFDMKALNRYEECFVTNHLDPIMKIFNNLIHLLATGSIADFQGLSAPLRTRLLASLEILANSADDSLGGRGIIMRQMYTVANGGTISMDIPRLVRVPLTEHERNLSGCTYGVLPEMFPLAKGPAYKPPAYHSAVETEDVSNYFPKHFTALDRLLCRSHCKDFDVGMFERGRALIRHMLHECCQLIRWQQNSTGDGEEQSPFVCPVLGVMEAPDYEALLSCNYEGRRILLSNIARVMIVFVCYCTHKQLVKDKVFGLDHGLTLGDVEPDADDDDSLDDNDTGSDDNEVGLSLAFKDFPFTLEKVDEYTTRAHKRTTRARAESSTPAQQQRRTRARAESGGTTRSRVLHPKQTRFRRKNERVITSTGTSEFGWKIIVLVNVYYLI